MKVVCTYKSGGDFTAQHVLALKISLQKYMPCEFDFWCFTDKPEEVNDIADMIVVLMHDLPGWWSKIEMFRMVHDREQIIYFDLDVLILKDLTKFVEVVLENRTMMLRSADPVGELNNWPSSSIMAWYGNDLSEVYDSFIIQGDIIARTANNTGRAGQRTDQGFIRTIVNPEKFQDYLPTDYVLYKVGYMFNPGRLKNAHILNWTGKPRYQNMGKDFEEIKELWNEATLSNVT